MKRALAGQTEVVKEYHIGVEVFGKPDSWDPRIDPIVRVEFNRLRQKLRQYYEEAGADDAIIIEFPARGYVPVFTWRAASRSRHALRRRLKLPHCRRRGAGDGS